MSILYESSSGGSMVTAREYCHSNKAVSLTFLFIKTFALILPQIRVVIPPSFTVIATGTALPRIYTDAFYLFEIYLFSRAVVF
jgi:hypothetical protein